MSEHIFKRFDEKLDKLITTLIKMGSLAQDQIEVVLNALETNNIELAKFVIERDRKIDKYDVKIDKQCMNLFALQQPVAMDLRVIMSALSINRDIERIGDHVVNIAETIFDLQESNELLHKSTLLTMGRKAESMVVNALDAFMNRDVDMARRVIQDDDAVDALDAENLSTIIDLMSKKEIPISVGTSMIGISRNFERLADEATNIAEEVVFVVEAEFIRHKSPD
jgi:phosphate transport system protein